MTGSVAILKKRSVESESNRLLNWVKGGIYLAATVLALVGLFLLYTWWVTRNSNDRWLNWHEPLMGIGHRVLLITAALLHLAVATCLFSTRDLLTRSLVLLWMGFTHL